MAKEIYIPGLTAPVQNPEALKQAEEEIADIRRKVADNYVNEADRRTQEIESIIREVHEQCKNGEGPIEITKEMKDLGIEEQVRGIIFQYDLAAPFMRMLHDPDDD